MKSHWKTAVRDVAIVVVVVGVVAALYFQRSTVAKGLHNVRTLNWAWAVAASLVEILSMVAFAMLYRELLRANGVRLTLTWILAGTYSANAISIAVPVIGSGMAGRQTFRWFRLGGADPAAASLTLTVAGIVSTVTLAAVLTIGALLSGNPAAAGGGVIAAFAMLGVAAALALELRTEKGRSRLLRLAATSIRWSQRIVRRPRGHPETLARSVLDSLQRMKLGASTLAKILLWGFVNWWADVACWIFAMLAAGISGLPVGKAILVWTVGAGAASFSPTPAGIGAVEVAMIGAMAGFGVRGPDAITAVLVYRIISLKGAVTLWGLFYGNFQRRRLRSAGSLPIAE